MEEVAKIIESPKIDKVELGEIGKALVGFQSECPSIEKNTQGYGYKYADLANIITTIKPHLKKAGLALTQAPYRNGNDVGVKTMLIHGASGQILDCDISADSAVNKAGKMSQVQGMGSIITYLRRYSLSILGIVTDEDTDGAEPNDNKTGSQKKTPPAQTTEQKATFLTKAQYESAMKADVKGIEATIKTFSTATKKMKGEYKTALETQLKKLKDGDKPS